MLSDLQLAAELGKTLLERNRELESTIKQQNAVIEDQLQEIEYLSKQTAALREVNDSRLRIYEQLEISIQELEKNNQRLSAESSSDKKKIKDLCSTLESLEARCDELQRSLEEARSGAQQQGRGRNKRRSLIMDEQNLRRSHSCENTPQNSEDRVAEDSEMRSKLEELQDKMKLLQKEKESEVRKKEELEIQLACMSQENAVLHDQLVILREKEVTLRSFDEELASLDDTSSGRLCRKCLGNVDEMASNPTIYDLQDSIEDTDISIESTHGECALVRLKNGGYAWGSQESLASIGQVMSRMGSEGTSPGTEASDAPHNSLLSELDTSYRILIEKYEALLEAREQQQQQQQQQQNNANRDEGLVHPGVDDMSGPMSLVMTDSMHDASSITLKCQRCHTCTCDMKPSVTRPKSNMEEFSEVETSSSGFSDGESRLSNKSTQTGEEVCLQKELIEDLTPTVPSRCLDLSSPVNPCDRRFQAAPEYKKLFQEIFTVLKQSVDETETKEKPGKPGKVSHQPETERPSKKTTETKDDEPEVAVEEEKISHVEMTKPVSPPEKQVSPQKEKMEVSPETPQGENKENQDINTQSGPAKEERSPVILDDQKVPEEQRVTHKPPRPDSLDLGNGSRPTSRQKRRSRYRARLDSYQQQQQFGGQYQQTQGNYSNEGNHSGHRHHRRERDHSQNHHHHHHHRQQGNDYPSLRTEAENEHNKTRIIYNSSRSRCEHHRSRRSRGRSNNRQRHNQNNQEQSTSNANQQNSDSESRGRPAPPKINYPSVEVAKLRKLEMSYAEVLKSSFNRSHYNHRRY